MPFQKLEFDLYKSNEMKVSHIQENASNFLYRVSSPVFVFFGFCCGFCNLPLNQAYFDCQKVLLIPNF